MHKALRTLLIVLAVVAVLAAGVFASINITKNWVATVTWDNPDLAQLADGDYPGSSQLQMPIGAAAANGTVKVVVRLKDHRYAGIDIIDPVRVAPTLQPLAEQIISKQSLELGADAVTGATVTKKAFMSAVAQAVTSHVAQ